MIRSERIRIAFLVRSLEPGGAELQLVQLATRLDPLAFAPIVYCFYRRGDLLPSLADAGVPVIALRKRGRYDLIAFWQRLRSGVAALKPSVLHSFMGPPNIFAALVKGTCPGMSVVWGVRASNMDLKRYDYSWRLTFFAERLLSRRADLIVANSYAGRDYFVTKGFAERRIEVVPNGIDLDRFANGNRFGRKFREEIGVADDEILIGIVARQDPMKGYDVFLRAAAQLAARRTKVRFVCVGSEGLLSSEALRVLSRSLGIADQVVWTGYRADVPAVLAGLDIATSASVFGEGFSNAVAEAMAAATPCVGTDVGDTARILGDTGLVVPPGDAGALAEAWLHLLDMAPEERRRLGTRARARVVENYAVARMVARMSDLYRALAARRAAVL